MANQENQIMNPFEDEKPQIVHLEKDQTHYEYCRMQMHDIEHVHRRTFFCNLGLCIFVCLLAVFHVYIGGFDLMSGHGIDISRPASVLTIGIFQIVSALIIIVLGYLAWANYRSLNIILEMWYVVVTVFGIVRLDYLTGLVGVVGIVFYYFSIRELRREESLAHMDGYPEFHEKLDISNSDYVVQTLLAHKGERLGRKKKTGKFASEYSLRNPKKRRDLTESAADERDAGTELAEELQKHIEAQRAPETEAAKSETEAKPAAAQEPEAAETFSEADEIMAEAEAKAKKIIAEAVAKANSLKGETETDAAPQKKNGSRKKHR